MDTEIIYYNNEFVSKEEARISPDDRGFYFADGVYEVIRYYKGKPFRMKEHLDRLVKSIQKTRINLSEKEVFKLEETANSLVKKNELQDEHSIVYIQITRGEYMRFHQFPPKEVTPTIYMFTNSISPNWDDMNNGIKVIKQKDIRWMRCDIKSITLLPNVMLYQEAREQGAHECLFIRDGLSTEAAHSNVLYVKNGTIYTHPVNNFILDGITRRVVLEIAERLKIPFIEEAIQEKYIFTMDEVFVVGTGNEITPVIKVDSYTIGDGKPGKITSLLQKEYFSLTYEGLAGQEVG